MIEATAILVVGGITVLFLGLLLGIPMIITRRQSARAPRYLLAAHLAAIIQGGMLLALTVAVDFSALPAGVETIGAGLLVGGVALFDSGLVLNWIQGVADAFAEGSLGNKISGLGTPLVLIGAAILLYGVLAAAGGG